MMGVKIFVFLFFLRLHRPIPRKEVLNPFRRRCLFTFPSAWALYSVDPSPSFFLLILVNVRLTPAITEHVSSDLFVIFMINRKILI